MTNDVPPDIHHAKAAVDHMLATAFTSRAGVGLPRGIDLTMHRPASARVGTARYQEFFETMAEHPRPWSIDDMLPTALLAARAIPQYPRWTFAPGRFTVDIVPYTNDAEQRIKDLLAAIQIPAVPYQWRPYFGEHAVDDDPPPWTLGHRHNDLDDDPPPWTLGHRHNDLDDDPVVYTDQVESVRLRRAAMGIPTGDITPNPDLGPNHARLYTCGLPRPHNTIGIGDGWLLLLSMIAVGAIAAWIIIGAVLP